MKEEKEINASKIYSPVGKFAERAKKRLAYKCHQSITELFLTGKNVHAGFTKWPHKIYTSLIPEFWQP